MRTRDDELIYEAYGRPGPEEFRMTEDDFTNAEEELGGVRLSTFVKEHNPDKPRSVALHTTYVQKHYGKIRMSGKTPVTGDSIADAVKGLGGGGLESELRSEERMGKGYIVTKMESGDDAEQEMDKQARTSASVARHYDNIDRGETNYRGD